MQVTRLVCREWLSTNLGFQYSSGQHNGASLESLPRPEVREVEASEPLVLRVQAAAQGPGDSESACGSSSLGPAPAL